MANSIDTGTKDRLYKLAEEYLPSGVGTFTVRGLADAFEVAVSQQIAIQRGRAGLYSGRGIGMANDVIDLLRRIRDTSWQHDRVDSAFGEIEGMVERALKSMGIVDEDAPNPRTYGWWKLSWKEWLASEAGKVASDPDTLRGTCAAREYLKNRLWTAFRAGTKASGPSQPEGMERSK